jgi:hypothetical protein
MLSACSTGANSLRSDESPLPTAAEPNEMYMDASGPLIADEASGCLWIGHRTDQLWPPGYRARFVDGVGQLVDGNGTVVAEEGDVLGAGGGGGSGQVDRCGGTAFHGVAGSVLYIGGIVNCTELARAGEPIDPPCERALGR